ncbi:hypothetical protein Taro_003596 [Colocasia esculenta]|uniref:Secreted protein n=1 Tax=Colocasia esculenta TaxID=4460 RepID=A0A843TS98_COLES|nr:hypothetical protein [Colocasia esculenta]
MALVVTFLLPLFGATSACTLRVMRGAGLADVRNPHELCSTRASCCGGFRGDSAFRHGFQRAFDAKASHGLGETSCRSRKFTMLELTTVLIIQIKHADLMVIIRTPEF